MGLSQLLAVSRSVRTIKDGPARYRMADQRLLPKFGGEKPAAEAQTTLSASLDPSVATKPENGGVVEVPRAGLSQPEIARTAAFTEAAKQLKPFDGWSFLRNPFGRATGRRNESGPVQAELSLDAVKPVRNDLSDLEIEPDRSSRRGLAREMKLSAPVSAAVVTADGGWWQWLKTRLFRARDTN